MIPKGFIGLPILLAILAVFAVAAGGTYVYLQHRKPPPEFTSTDVCVQAQCWGHAGCNYYECTAKDGTTYTKFAQQDATPPVAVDGMSKYTDTDFGFSFWYPNGWRVGSNNLDKGGTFQLYNYSVSKAACPECSAKGENKIEATLITDPKSFFYPTSIDDKVTVIAGQKSYKVNDEWLSYAIELPSHPGTYLAITIYGDSSNRNILETLVKSIVWSN